VSEKAVINYSGDLVENLSYLEGLQNKVQKFAQKVQCRKIR